MDEQKLKALQQLQALMAGDTLDLGEVVKAMAVSLRAKAAVNVQAAGITDPKAVDWVYTGKY